MCKVLKQPKISDEICQIEIIPCENKLQVRGTHPKDGSCELRVEPATNNPQPETNSPQSETQLSEMQNRYDGLRVRYDLLKDEFEKMKKEQEVEMQNLTSLRQEVHSYTQALQQTKEEVKNIEKEARNKGYNNGLQKGKEDGIAAGKKEVMQTLKEVLEEINTTRNLLFQIVEEAQKEREKFLARNEEEILELSISVAKKIIGEEIATNKKVIFSVIKSAVDKLKERDKITLRVNPADLETINQFKEKVMYLQSKVSEVQYLSDESVEKGGVLVETSYGIIDATVDSQIKELKKTLI
ncbi:MAG: Yop proteins translocation protein L [candidate division WS2 bacterium]|nr:Yop proteins translocation protein L [Candidatus Lithacetigena glycinireducens]